MKVETFMLNKNEEGNVIQIVKIPEYDGVICK